jgi:DNA-binding Lrp family transcriptional regulator
MTLDRIDRALVRALQNDARLSNKELAARVGLAPSSCLERVRRLRQAGVLKGFHAEVAPGALGIGLQALIAVQLRQHSRQDYGTFRAHAQALPEVLALFHVTGAHDFLVHVAVRDASHLRDLALDAFTTREEVAHIQTSLIFEYTRTPALPDYAGPPETGGAGGRQAGGRRARGRTAGQPKRVRPPPRRG